MATLICTVGLPRSGKAASVIRQVLPYMIIKREKAVALLTLMRPYVSILVTFPGKYGDLIWALPTLRALARRTGEAVDLLTSADMTSICPLIAQQPYIDHVLADPRWIRVHIDTQDRLPPWDLDATYTHVFHLGYRGWPQRPLPFETLDCLNAQRGNTPRLMMPFQDAELDLGTPWILNRHPQRGARISVGFSDDHFELKYGLVQLLARTQELQGVGASPRWSTEGRAGQWSWEQSAAFIHESDVFLGCNSGLHVLAVACGTPVVLMEPSPARHNPIFFPLGTTGPQVTLVTGNDGQPTWDARHVADTLHHVLSTVPVRTSTVQETP